MLGTTRDLLRSSLTFPDFTCLSLNAIQLLAFKFRPNGPLRWPGSTQVAILARLIRFEISHTGKRFHRSASAYIRMSTRLPILYKIRILSEKVGATFGALKSKLPKFPPSVFFMRLRVVRKLCSMQIVHRTILTTLLPHPKRFDG